MTASCHFQGQLQCSLVSILYSLFTSIICIEITCDLQPGQMWKKSERLWYIMHACWWWYGCVCTEVTVVLVLLCFYSFVGGGAVKEGGKMQMFKPLLLCHFILDQYQYYLLFLEQLQSQRNGSRSTRLSQVIKRRGEKIVSRWVRIISEICPAVCRIYLFAFPGNRKRGVLYP